MPPRTLSTIWICQGDVKRYMPWLWRQVTGCHQLSHCSQGHCWICQCECMDACDGYSWDVVSVHLGWCCDRFIKRSSLLSAHIVVFAPCETPNEFKWKKPLYKKALFLAVHWLGYVNLRAEATQGPEHCISLTILSLNWLEKQESPGLYGRTTSRHLSKASTSKQHPSQARSVTLKVLTIQSFCQSIFRSHVSIVTVLRSGETFGIKEDLISSYAAVQEQCFADRSFLPSPHTAAASAVLPLVKQCILDIDLSIVKSSRLIEHVKLVSKVLHLLRHWLGLRQISQIPSAKWNRRKEWQNCINIRSKRYCSRKISPWRFLGTSHGPRGCYGTCQRCNFLATSKSIRGGNDKCTMAAFPPDSSRSDCGLNCAQQNRAKLKSRFSKYKDA